MSTDEVKNTLTQLDDLEKQLQRCEHRLAQIGRAKVSVYFGVPCKAREGFNQVYQAINHMRWILGCDINGPEG